MGNICSIDLSCDDLFSRCLDCTIRKAAYISKLKENLDVLQTELQQLIEARNDVMGRVIIEEQQRRKRTDRVQGWLTRVQGIEIEVGELQKRKPQEMEKLCLGGYCSRNCKSSYRFGKTVADMLKVVNDLRAEGAFQEVAQKIPEDPVDMLQIQLRKLIAARKDVENRITIAEQQRKQATEKVKLWLSSVIAVEAEVAALKNLKSQEIEKLQLGGCKATCEFGRRVADILKEVTSLNAEGVFQEVTQEVQEDPAVALPIDRTIIGQESTFDKVQSCLTEGQAGIVGIYGLGGVGKTTLLKQINNNFRNQKHNFDVVMWVVVSKEPKIEKIQDDIAKRIGLDISEESWKSKSVEDKALDISNILSRKKFVLLLDDIWQQIELSELGVSPQSLNIGSKILFTTRSLDVCGQMDADEKIEVKCLTHDQAWRLFQEKVGSATLEAHTGIREQAELVARECDGLPLALITIGRTMASKRSLQEWKNALRDLKTTASKFSGMEEKVYSRLKYSYDNLPNDITRSCLLYCCLFPENFEILKESLIHYWISEKFLEAFDDGYTIIGDLLSACLLEKVDDDDYVKMHDVIRDMTLWIACKIKKEEESFLVRSGTGLPKAPKIEEWNGAKRISLIGNKIKSLSAIPTCPLLLTLLLDVNPIEMITDDFFQFMPSLRVLSLRRNEFLSVLPSGFSSLVLLHHLDLSYTSIRELPQELKALVNLRYLNLAGTDSLCEIPHQLISSFSKLQVLRMIFIRISGRDISEGSVLSADCEPLIKELLCLEHLNVFSITLTTSRVLKIFLTIPKLVSCTQFLDLYRGNDSPFDVLSVAYMKNLTHLRISCCNWKEMKIDCREEVQSLVQSGFCNLRTVILYELDGWKDMTWLVFAPKLKYIELDSCYRLEEIISFEKLCEFSEILGEINLFAELEFIIIKFAPNLRSIYWDPLPFRKLKEIEVFRCPNLIKLPLNSSIAKERKIVIKGEKDWWEHLQWEDQDTKDAFSTGFQLRE